MANQEEINTLIKLLEEAQPADFFRKINEVTTGITAVLRFLYEAEGPVTAGQISSFMNVSTARIAVLLKKMVAKGLLTKGPGADDARKTVVKLCDFGRCEVEKMQAELDREIEELIDVVGMERMLEFVEISKEIRSVIKGPSLEFMGKEQI